MANSKRGKKRKFVHHGEKRKAIETVHPHLVVKNDSEKLLIHRRFKK